MFLWQPTLMGNKISFYQFTFQISVFWVYLSSSNEFPRISKSRRKHSVPETGSKDVDNQWQIGKTKVIHACKINLLQAGLSFRAYLWDRMRRRLWHRALSSSLSISPFSWHSLTWAGLPSCPLQSCIRPDHFDSAKLERPQERIRIWLLHLAGHSLEEWRIRDPLTTEIRISPRER